MLLLLLLLLLLQGPLLPGSIGETEKQLQQQTETLFHLRQQQSAAARELRGLRGALQEARDRLALLLLLVQLLY